MRLNYQRNTVDVDDAVAQLQQKRRIPIKAVIMVPTYRAAAKFFEKTRDLYPDKIYTSVSFVGSTALADELTLLGKKYATGVIVTQVVPAVDGHSSLVLDYKSALAKYFPGEAPDYVSLEGYVDANVLIAALQRNGPQLDTEKNPGRSARSRHRAWHARDLRPLRPPGRAQGVGHTARRDGTLSTHRPAVATTSRILDRP